MGSYKQFGFMSLAFPDYKNVISNVRGPERGKRIMVPVPHTGKREAARRLRSKQKLFSLP